MLPLYEDQPAQVACFVVALLGVAAARALWVRARAKKTAASLLELKKRVAGDEPAAIVPGFENGKARNLVLMKDQLAVSEGFTSAGDPVKVKKATFVQDKKGATGLEIEDATGRKLVVSGFEPIARAYAQLKAAKTSFDYQFAVGIGERVKAALGRVHPKEQQAVGEWLLEKELPLDLIFSVDYEGALRSAGSRTVARLLVTNLRLGLLAQTQTVEQRGNMRITTTHFNLVGYPFPLADSVRATTKPTCRKSGVKYELVYGEGKGPPPNAAPPSLLLGKEHASVLVPTSLCDKPITFVDGAPTVGSLIWDGFWGGIGFAILTGPIAGIALALISQGFGYSMRHRLEDLAAVVAVSGAIAGFVLRSLGAFELFTMKRALARVAAASKGA